MSYLIDDIGSFPLPGDISRTDFNGTYRKAQEVYARGEKMEDYRQIKSIFYNTVASSLKRKVDAGLDIINYPQHFDMHQQFLNPVMKNQQEPFLVRKQYAVIPEVYVAEKEARKYYEETGEKLKLKVCVTGPLELYSRTEFGQNIYEDVLMNLSESVNRFLKNSMVNSRYMEVPVVSIDEPSLGLSDPLNIENDGIIKALDKSVRGVDADVQIHLHSLKAMEYPLQSKNINVLTGEFASNPKNMDIISLKDLEGYDKFLRGGIASTNIDFKIGYYASEGIDYRDEDLPDPVHLIEKTYRKLKDKYGDRMKYVGPDCGLGSWPSRDVAQEVLKRTVDVARGKG